jgi:TusA-related sulfurtransferase
MSTNKIPDYTELTCTNLMLKLKIKLKKLKEDETLEFYSNREQFDNIRKPFSKDGYILQNHQVDDNKYHISIVKK